MYAAHMFSVVDLLIDFGQTNERIARMQETYATNASSSWLDALERSLAQMKDYQVCSSGQKIFGILY